ncbi:MAG: hypothetical protein IJW87_01935 [Clostridia bacterium]|nr:hypothetical protein [Clostridia bacterium]
MDQKQMQKKTDMRAFALTAVLCAISLVAALDMEYGTLILGHVLLMISVGILAVIFSVCDRAVFVLDAAAMLAILFFTSSGSIFASLYGACAVIAAIVLASAVRKKSEKTSAVLGVCLTITIGYAIVSLIWYASEGNSLVPSEMLSKLNGYFDSFKVPLAESVRASIDSLPEEMLAYYAKYEITKEMLLEVSLEAMEASVDMAQMLLPGTIIFLAQVMAYFGVVSFEKTVRASRCDVLLPSVRWFLYPSRLSCTVYLVITSIYAITLFFAQASTFTILVTNCWIALMPVMLACGFRSLCLRLKHPRLRKTTIVILILFVIGAFFLPDTALSFGVFLLTFMGAQDVSFSRAAEQSKKQFEDQNKQ